MPSTTPVVIRVRGEVIHQHVQRAHAAGIAPTIAGYRYTAVLMDGSEVILRGKSKRRYEWAYQWNVPVAAGEGVRGLGTYFTFSSYRIQPLQALAELRIEWL
jgi:hypothetical protein